MAIREECDRRGWLLLDVIRDQGQSGKTLDRPGIRDALEQIAGGDAAGLVVAKLDRLTRSVVDLGTLLDWFANEAEATLLALDLAIDTSTPSGRMVANVFGSVVGWEREVIAAPTRDALAARRSQGDAISRPAVADRPELVERIRAMRSDGMTLRAIANTLNAGRPDLARRTRMAPVAHPVHGRVQASPSAPPACRPPEGPSPPTRSCLACRRSEGGRNPEGQIRHLAVCAISA